MNCDFKECSFPATDYDSDIKRSERNLNVTDVTEVTIYSASKPPLYMPPTPPNVVWDIFMQLGGFPMIYHAYVGQGNTYMSKNGATVHILW